MFQKFRFGRFLRGVALIAVSVVVLVFFDGAVRAGQIANVKFIHDYISAKHDIPVAIASGQSPLQAANMQYLLKSIDVANEILNGCPVSNYYGNPVYSTKRAVDTTASITGINTLIKLYQTQPVLDESTPPPTVFNGGCASSEECKLPGYFDAKMRACVNGPWIMLCDINGYVSYDGNMFVTFRYANPTKMSYDGLFWQDFKQQASSFAPHGEWEFSNLKGPTSTIWVMTHDGGGTENNTNYQYYRSGAVGNFNKIKIGGSTYKGKFMEHIPISEDKFAAFSYSNNDLALFSYTSSGAPSHIISTISDPPDLATTSGSNSGGKWISCDQNGWCVLIAQRCSGHPDGEAYRFLFSDIGTCSNISSTNTTNCVLRRDLKNNIDHSKDMTTMLGRTGTNGDVVSNGRYRKVKFCNGKFLVTSDGGRNAAISTDATGEYWEAVTLPTSPSLGEDWAGDKPVGITYCTAPHDFRGFNAHIGCYDNKFFIGGVDKDKVWYSADPVNGWTAMDLPGKFTGKQKFDTINGQLFVFGGFGSQKMFAYNPAQECLPQPGYIRNPIFNTCTDKFYDKTYFHNSLGQYCVGLCWNMAYVKGSSATNFDTSDCEQVRCVPSVCPVQP